MKENFAKLVLPLLFFYQGSIQFYDLPENATVYILYSCCPKIACCAQASLWGTRAKNIKKQYS